MFTKLDMVLAVVITAAIAYRSGYSKAREKCLEAIMKGASESIAKNEMRKKDNSATTKVGISVDALNYLRNKANEKSKGEDECEDFADNTTD